MNKPFARLLDTFKAQQNPQISPQMAKYMKNHFEFLGIQSKLRKELQRAIFKDLAKNSIDFEFIDECFECAYRELQYAGIDYLKSRQKLLNKSHISKLQSYILSKSWWDSIDDLARIVGDIGLNDESVNDILLEWSKDSDIWLRRVAILHQLLRKERTNTALLETILTNNLNQKEFFINKAIGWALRDYSKHNPTWVRGFLDKYKDSMSALSIKEASKYI